MSSTNPPKVHQVAVLLYNGNDILDFSGPTEVLANAASNTDIFNPTKAFSVHLIAASPTIKAGGCMTVKVEASIDEALERIKDFDILVVPGAMPHIVQDLIKQDGPEARFIKAFNVQNPKRESNDQRIILSVCTGALLLAATKVLSGLKATTHHLAYDMLKEVDETIDVVQTIGHGGTARYVDSGVNHNGIRIVTAGGVSCGLDAAFYVVELKVGREAAEREAAVEEFDWKRA